MPNNGIGSWFVKCRRCGHEHRITNLGRRRAITPDRYVVQVTVHEAGCLGYRLLDSGDHRWYMIGDQLPERVAALLTRAEEKAAKAETS